MMEEGIGKTAPARIAVPVTRADLLTCKDIAEERARFRNYAKGGTWSQGLLDAAFIEGVGSLTREQMSIFVGSVGEYAVQCVLGRAVGSCGIDSELRERGDFGIDMKHYGMSIQVKTRKKPRTTSLIKVGTNRALVACFAEWTGGSMVDVLGWEWTSAINTMQQEVSVFGEWVNIVVHDIDLLPMSRLVQELETWKALQCR